MRRITLPTSLPEKLHLVSQILIFGSLGSASSAVVYFLQAELRRIRRLGCMLDSGRRFTEKLRQHGISEATIQRLYENNTEDHIFHMVARGQIQLEPVIGGPKLTSSPYKGEKYHVVSIPRSKKRKRVSGPSHVGDPSISALPCASSNSDEHGSFKSPLEIRSPRPQLPKCLLFRPELSAVARKHQIAPSDVEKPTLPNVPASRESLTYRLPPFSLSPLGKRQRPMLFNHHRTSGQACRHATFAAASQLAQSATFGDHRHRLESLCSQILLRYRFSQTGVRNPWKSIFESHAHAQIPHPRAADQGALCDNQKVVDSGGTHASATFQKFLHFVGCQWLDMASGEQIKHMSLLKELIAAEYLALDLVVPSLLSNRNYSLILLLYQNLRHRATWTSTLYGQVLRGALEGARIRNVEPSLAIDVISDAPRYVDVQTYMSAKTSFDGTPFVNEIRISTMRKLISSASHGQPQNSQFIRELLDHQTEHRVCLKALEESSALSEEILMLFLPSLLGQPSPVPSNASRRLLALASRHDFFGAVVQIYQHHPVFLNQDTAETIRKAYLELPSRFYTDVDLDKLLQVVSGDSTPSEAAILLVLTYSSAVEIESCRRVRFLTEVLRTVDLQIGSDILLSLKKPMGTEMEQAIQSLQSNLLTRIWDSTRKADKLHEMWINLRKWHEKTNQASSYEVDKTIVSIAVRTRKFIHFRLYAQCLASHPEIDSHWDVNVDLMTLYGRDHAWEDVDKMLERLHQAGSIPSDVRSRSKFYLVFEARVETRGAKDALEFARICVTKYDLVLDPRTYDSIVTSAIAKQSYGDCLETIRELCKLSADLRVDVGVRRETVYRALKCFSNTNPGSSRFLYGLFVAIWKWNNRLVSKDLCAFVAQSLAMDARAADTHYWKGRPKVRGSNMRLNSTDFHKVIHAKLKKRIEDVRSASDQSNWLSENMDIADLSVMFHGKKSTLRNDSKKSLSPCLTKMQAALSLGHPEVAIEEYERFSQSNPSILGRSLEIAVQACLKLHDVSRAKKFQSEAAARGHDTSRADIPLMLYQIRSQNPETGSLRDLVFGWYESGKATTMLQQHAVLVTAVHSLLKRNEYSAAIDLLVEVHRRPSWTSKYPLNIVVYNTCLATYAKANHLHGIVWTVNTVLQKKYTLTPNFFLALSHSMKEMKQRFVDSRQYGKASVVNSFYRQLFQICRARRIRQARNCHSFGRALVHILLYDAPHPVVGLARSTEDGTFAALDTKVGDSKREQYLRFLQRRRLSKETRRRRRIRAYDAWRGPLAKSHVTAPFNSSDSDAQAAMKALQQMAS